MKRILTLGGLLLICGILRAATPLDQPFQGNGPYSNTTLSGSTTSINSVNIALTFPVITKTSGSTSYNGRNCVSNLILQLGFGSTFYLLDGQTTAYVIYGAGIATSTTVTSAGFTGTITVNRDHLGPYCGTAGNSMMLWIPAPTLAGGANANAINAEGFTFFPYAANAGQ